MESNLETNVSEYSDLKDFVHNPEFLQSLLEMGIPRTTALEVSSIIFY